MHAATQVLEPIRRTRLFRTLREKHGIFIHLEDGHRTYWGIVAYLAAPSESKPDVDASPWQFVDYIVANKISDKPILYSHLEQRTSDKIEPAREFFFRHFKDIPTLLATVWAEDVSLGIGVRRGARQVRL